VRNSNIVHVPLFIEDAFGNPPIDAATPLYESRLRNAILAPDGHTVTRAEFDAPRGTATVKCVDNGTQITLQLTGLIPNGVYTVWIVTFRSPGFDPTFARLIGLGTLGTPDGAHSVLRASGAGEASLTTLTREGKLSVMGKLEECALEDELEFHVVCAYHIDGATWGPQLGPNGSAVEQLAFIFRH
jgi:hypothetical protein